MPRILLKIANNNAPQQVTGSTTLFRNATFFGVSGFNPSGIPINNSGIVYFGVSSGECVMNVATGGSTQYVIPTTQERDSLSNYWYQGNSLDGLYIIYN